MHGVSGVRTMPIDCGMKGMHGSTSATKTKKLDALDVVQSTKVTKLPGDTKGNAVDVKI